MGGGGGGGGGGDPTTLLGILRGKRDKLQSFGPLARVPLRLIFFFYQAESIEIVSCDLLWHEQNLKKRQALIEVA